MKRLMKIAIVSSALVIGASTLTACSHHYKTPEERAAWLVNKISDDLTLNDMQEAKLNVVKNEMLNLRKQFDGDKDATHKQMMEVISKPTLDRDALLNMINTRTQVVSTNAPKVVAALGDFYDSLDPQQQAKVREKMKEGMEHHHGWHH